MISQLTKRKMNWCSVESFSNLRGFFQKRMGKKRIIIIGSGLAGFSTGLEIMRRKPRWVNYLIFLLLKKEVFVLEKTGMIGGNSKKATSGINGIKSKTQIKKEVKDNRRRFYCDIMKSGQGLASHKLVTKLVRNSPDAISFLESFRVDLSVLFQCGGHSMKRTHYGKCNVGGHIITKLFEASKNFKRFRILTNCKVIGVYRNIFTSKKELMKEKMIVKYVSNNQEFELQCDDVVCCTGGYALNKKLIGQYIPKFINFPTSSGNHGTGDCFEFLKEFKVKVAHMENVQIHPTSLINPNDPNSDVCFLGPEALRASGAILLNGSGERFVNELGLRDEVVKRILNEGNLTRFDTKRKVVFLLLNEKAAKKFGEMKIKFYTRFGFVESYENLAEFAKGENLSYESLLNTIEKYNKAAEKGKDEFGKEVFPQMFTKDERLFRVFITPCIHYTIGGLKINERCQVYNEKGMIVPHLRAAGECTGGLHGKNRLAGNSLLECVVFGRIAAQEIIKQYNRKYGNLLRGKGYEENFGEVEENSSFVMSL